MYHNKKLCCTHKTLKLVSYYTPILDKLHIVNEFNQEALPRLYIVMNTEFRAKSKNNSEKDLFKLMNNSVFRKTLVNVRNNRH